MTGSSIEKYVDKAMFRAEEMPDTEPHVYLLWMTPDPLGAVAAASMMYEGKVIRSLTEVTDDDRRHYWQQIQKTRLQAPLEFVKLHFMIEGVDRAFTHQDVRQRTAVFAQESMRFAVKEDIPFAYPPSMRGDNQRERDLRDAWDETIEHIEQTYNVMIANGVPGEDARGLLPHATLTRLHYCTDLKNLHYHAGNRLCTQAQFIWRKVFLEIVNAIANFAWQPEGEGTKQFGREWAEKSGWQFREIARSGFFAPACYEEGHCPFKADFDRGCTIRSRVDANAKIGRPSEEWHLNTVQVAGISPSEWLEDPEAAWVR